MRPAITYSLFLGDWQKQLFSLEGISRHPPCRSIRLSRFRGRWDYRRHISRQGGDCARLKGSKCARFRPDCERGFSKYLIVKKRPLLDICAGSGAIGIEAISRGASEVIFIDRSRRACLVIEANLNTLGITRQATIINHDAGSALKRLEAQASVFDIAFFDPPYASEIYPLVMRQLAAGHILSAEGVVVIEHRAKTPPAPEYGGLRMYREVKQGDSALAFYSFDTSRWPAPADPRWYGTIIYVSIAQFNLCLRSINRGGDNK